MKRSYIPALIALITISLLGLVAIQIYWIRNSITLRDAQFRHAVKVSLAEVNKTLETEEKIYRLQQHDFARLMLSFDSIKTKRFNRTIELPSVTKEDSLVKFNDKGHWYRPVSQESRKERLNELTSPEEVERFLREEKRAIASKVNRNTSFDEQQTEEIAKLIFDISTLEFGSNFLSRVGVRDLDSLLAMALKNNGGITTDYHFGIFNSFDEAQMVPERSIPYTQNVLSDGYKLRLLPSDYVSPITFIHIWFPKQESYLIKTLWPLLLSSTLFLITIILAFAYTIRTILRQKKVSEIKNDFINNMTHELKTPISTISLACEALNDPSMTKSTERVNQYVGMIRDENKRLGVLVENVLRSAVLDRSEMALQKDQVNLHRVINAAIKNIELQARSKGGVITQYLQADNPVIEGDQIHLTNVVYNLLDNAIKYSRENPEIRVSTESDSTCITIRVQDNGIGISKEDQKRVFEKLFRVPTGNVHNIKGFGLGLSYVKVVAEKHHGSVSVESELGKGSTFCLKLPYNYDL